jgi:hypothetical protein
MLNGIILFLLILLYHMFMFAMPTSLLYHMFMFAMLTSQLVVFLHFPMNCSCKHKSYRFGFTYNLCIGHM